MSYCRFSSNNFRCDLYCYETSDGYITHVASYRLRLWVRLLWWITDKRHKGFRYHRKWFSANGFPHYLTHKRIKHPLAGKCFCDETEEEMFDRVRKLREEGFMVRDIYPTHKVSL